MAKKSLGTKLQIADVTPIVVGSLTSINGLEVSADTIDVTTLNSTDGYREFIQGFKDAGEVSVEGYLDVTTGNGQKEMFDLFESGETQAFEIVFPTTLNAKWAFNGIVTGFSTGASLEDPLSFSATIKVTGKPTLTVTV